VRWALAASLLCKPRGGPEGLLWALAKKGPAGVAWVMHALPRVGWLLAAAESCYCSAGARGGGPTAQHLRSALAAILDVRDQHVSSHA
jgi:hypothetical protein